MYPDQPQYPNQGQPQYPNQGQSQPQYPGNQPNQGGYPPQQPGYPPQQPGYPPTQGAYPPDQGGYPPSQPYQPFGGAPGTYPAQPSGYPSAQPVYPGAPQPNKSNNRVLVIVLSVIGGVLALCIIGGIVITLGLRGAANKISTGIDAAATSISATSTAISVQETANPISSLPTDTPQPTAAALVYHKIGDTVKAGTWTITINSVKTDPGGQYDSPKAGDTYLVIDVTAVNNDSKTDQFSSFIAFNLKDSTGQQYTQSFASIGTLPDGEVAPGDKVRGQIPFEIPQSQHSFTLSYQPDFASDNTFFWKLSA